MTHRRQGFDFRMIPQTPAMELRALPPSGPRLTGQAVLAGPFHGQKPSFPGRATTGNAPSYRLLGFQRGPTKRFSIEPNATGPTAQLVILPLPHAREWSAACSTNRCS